MNYYCTICDLTIKFKKNNQFKSVTQNQFEQSIGINQTIKVQISSTWIKYSTII